MPRDPAARAPGGPAAGVPAAGVPAAGVPAAAPAGYRAGEPGLRRASTALFLAGLATFALLYVPQPLLPVLADDFAVSAGASTLALSAATAGLAVGLLVTAPLSERLGRTRLVHASLLASSLLGLACAVAPTWSALVALRGVQGLALAGLPAVAVAYLREEVHSSAAGWATGLYVGGNAIGGMTGRLVGAGLAELGGWRPATAGTAVLALGVAVAVWRLLPASRRFTPAPAGLRQLARRTRGVLTDPALLALYGLAFLLMGAFVAVYNAMAFRLAAEPYGLGPGLAGLVFVVYALGSVSSTTAGRVADAVGRRAVVPVAVAVVLAGALLTLATPLWLVVVGLAVLTAGFFAAHGVASGWVAARAGAGGRATAQAASTYLVAYYAGSSVGGSVAGVAWGAARWPGVVALVGACVAGALVLALLLRRTRSLLPAGDRA
ncbi:MFS transporter [uncultured Pseudokineococcus sp.]|uniref:MFS transporter n=1 Tax=uncultured Pseudokineococcus sp. TaxID=1642928 RepID=UPI0026294A41|nr:MFS transporter [uncultured Pseudokineococcus sp.]